MCRVCWVSRQSVIRDRFERFGCKLCLVDMSLAGIQLNACSPKSLINKGYLDSFDRLDGSCNSDSNGEQPKPKNKETRLRCLRAKGLPVKPCPMSLYLKHLKRLFCKGFYKIKVKCSSISFLRTVRKIEIYEESSSISILRRLRSFEL